MQGGNEKVNYGIEKFYSFLKHSILPRKYRTKFSVVYSNIVLDKETWKFRVRKWESNRNHKVLRLIIGGYLLLLFATYYLFDIFINSEKDENRDSFYYTLLDVGTFNYFFNAYFNGFFLNGAYFSDISNAYMLDLFFKDKFIDIYNLYFFHSLDFFFVILNLIDIKYEHDKCLKPVESWDKIEKMELDLFNIDLLDYNNSFFNSFCIFEFYFEFNDCSFNIFNSLFFDQYCLYNVNEFYNDFIDINEFSINIPYTFFLLRTFYSIHWRRVRYNYYVRNLDFLNEYTSFKYLFIMINNPGGKNRTRLTTYYYQKLYTLKYFDKHIFFKDINDWFGLYSSKFFRYENIFYYDNFIDNIIFNSILNHNDFRFLSNINFDLNLNLIYDFFNENLLDYMYLNNIIEGFRLLMSFRSVYKFRLVNSAYNEIEEFVECIYALPLASVMLYSHLNLEYIYDLNVEIFNKNLLDLYFLKDLFNINDDIYFFYYIQLSSFYIKLYYLIIYIVDPLFLYLFYSKCFPKRTRKYEKIVYYASIYMLYYGINNINKISFELINYFNLASYYLSWKLNILTYFDIYNNIYYYTQNIVNMINVKRFKDLVIKYKYCYNNNNIYFIYENYRYYIYIRDYYFQLLNENVEFCLLLFFINKIKFIEFYDKNVYDYFSSYISSNFIYRYYSLIMLMEFNFYNNWFDDRSKRDFWIYHDIKKYEGIAFYRNKYNII